MKHSTTIKFALGAVALALIGLRSASVLSDAVYTAGAPPSIAQKPLYIRDATPPLNMLVMGKDHKSYYEAYNDASDLNGDGALDVGYRGWELKNPAPADGASPYKIDYYGYFNSFACYSWQTDKFVPVSATTNKKCSGQWSGDFLNYLTTSRMDALRRVLYGGWRQVDSTSETILQGAYFPQDAHSWGKEYQSFARDGYVINDYAPLMAPEAGKYHLFAVTTVTGNTNAFPSYQAPLFRVLTNSSYRIWNWLSIEGPVANNKCFTSNNTRVDCVAGAASPWTLVPASALSDLSMTTWRDGVGNPASRTAMDTFFTQYAQTNRRCNTGPVAQINKTTSGNPFATGSCNNSNDNYLTRITGKISVPSDGEYRFAVDGDDAVDLTINGQAVVGWYAGHGNDRSDAGLTSHSGTINLVAGTYDIVFRHQDGTGGDSWGLFWENVGGSNSRQDYFVRVQTCPATASLREATCKAYPNGGTPLYKPTGILHDYGEDQRMYFGLITGSQRNNLQGGVLRRNISNFASEINPATGQFSDPNGIVGTIDRLRMIGGGYADSVTNNLTSDKNWNWANGTGNCPSIGGRALANGECRMWGNPIGEMMYEALRYFAGAEAATPEFSTGGSSAGGTEETTMGLAAATWKDPYKTTANGGLGYGACAKPNMTVISDINVSYDGDVPGSDFGDAVTLTGLVPRLSGFDAGDQGDQIWAAEFGAGPKNVFIGEAAGVTDNAPTLKSASSLGNIRGLAPEEPTKGGTYYSASVARFGRNADLSAAADDQNLTTYSVALASPLPRIEFATTGGRIFTILPFAKTVSGTFGGGTRKPTNTIVDFYVEQIVNLPGGATDEDVNDGRPYAVFRINYEDVEQGNDHDMDAIVRYEVKELNNNKVEVKLTSEYAAGSANQNIGYTISGSTRDGIYLEVRDTDSNVANSSYVLNTPAGVDAGGCLGSAVNTAPCNQGLPFVSTRVFNPRTQTPGDITTLRDPLWYAAKYGSLDTANWDANGDGEPDNYFLVTNPLNLRDQLSKAFDSIANQNFPVGSLGVSGARISGSSFTVQPFFNIDREGMDWTGDLKALRVNADGSLGTTLWTAKSQLAPATGAPAASARNIFTSVVPGPLTTRQPVAFEAANLGANADAQFAALGVNSTSVATTYGSGVTPAGMVSYLRGDQSLEAGGGTGTLRARSSVLGDIVNSEPVISAPRNDYGYGGYSDTMFEGYAAYLTAKEGRPTVVYAGANDGMFHAFNGATGRELFAYVPHGVLNQMGKLPLPDGSFDHRYYVDGQTTIVDAKSASGWKTVVVGTTGAGGRSVFGIDATNVSTVGANQVMWEWNGAHDPDIGYTLGKALILPLENGSWGAVFGNGYGGASSDPILYVVDVFTGALIKKIVANDGDTGADTDADNDANDPYNGIGQITAIDTDADGRADYIYGGDLQGNLWKFDISADTETSWGVAFSGSPLFTAATGTERQPITGGIRVSRGPGVGYSVFFGTGRYFVDGDNNVAADPQVQSFYGVLDNGTAAGTRANLTAQTITAETSADGTTTRTISQNLVPYFGDAAKRGWYIDLAMNTDADPALEGSGERFFGTPRIQNGKIFFVSFDPTGDSCAPGGSNLLYGLDLISGSGALTGVTTLTTSTAVSTTTSTGAIGLGTGAPITNVGVLALNKETLITPCPPGTVPGGPGCTDPGPSYEECQVVIYPGALVLPRPCGRQSWRQLR